MSIEELWGRVFERRGTVDIQHMPDNTGAAVRKLSTEDVLELIRSEDTRSVKGLLAHMERQRRQDWTARASLVLSVIALVVSALR